MQAKPRNIRSSILLATGGLAFYTVLLYTSLPSILPGYPAVAVAFFLWAILPGWFLQRAFFATRNTNLVEQMSVAFLMSMALAAVPGLVALTLHWSIDAFAISYAGAASIASGVSLFWQREKAPAVPTEEPEQQRLLSHAPLLLMIGIPLLAIATSPWWAGNLISRDFDDWVYMGYLSEYLGSNVLDASVPFSDARPGQFGRMQFNVWLVIQTLVADSAGVEPFDLLIDYLPPIMTLLAAAAMFTLAKGLFNKTSIALLAVMLLLAYGALDLTAHEGYGRNIFSRIGEDKMVASFILLPVSLLLGARFLASPSPRTFVAPVLAIGALFATHPMALLFFGAAMVPLSMFHAAVERTAASARAAVVISLPWLLLAGAFLIWSGDGSQRLDVTDPFRRAFHIIDVTDSLVIGSYHMFLHPMLIAAVLLAIPAWLVSRRSIGNQLLFGTVATVLLVTFVPFLATGVSNAVNEEAVYRLQWLIPVPLILAYSLDQAASWLATRWQIVRRPWLASLLPAVGVVGIVATALIVQEHYVIADDGAFYEKTSSSSLLPWTDGSIFLGGVDRAFSSGSRPTEDQEELFAQMQDRLPPGSEVLLQRSLGLYLYGMLYRVRPVIYGGAAGYLYRNLLVTALDEGLLERDELDEAIRTFGIDLVVVQKGSLTDSGLRAFARYEAQDLEAQQGEPELIVHELPAGGSYWAWAFGGLERERVGGQRFTIPNDIDPEDSTLNYVIELAPSEAVVGSQTVRLTVSY